MAAFQVSQIAPLHRRAFREFLLRPALCPAEEFDSVGEEPQNLSFGDGQLPSFRNDTSDFV